MSKSRKVDLEVQLLNYRNDIATKRAEFNDL